MKLLGIIAVAMAWLVLTMPASYAATVSIVYTGGSLTTSIPELATIKVSFQPQSLGSYNVLVNLTNVSDSISQALVFKCKDSDPKTCASNTPDSYTGPFNTVYKWADIATSGSYPQKANLLFLVKTSNQKGSTWSGYWHELSRTSSSQFFDSAQAAPSIEIKAKAVDNAIPIRNFVNDRKMLPFNPNWVSSVKLQSATQLYELASDSMPSSLSANLYSTGTLLKINNTHSIVFPKTSGITNGVALNLNPSYTCGNNNLEAGENPSTCCYEAGCSAGQYCDSGKSVEGPCKPTPSLKPVAAALSVPSCSQDHTLQVNMQFDNQPQDFTLASNGYTLNGVYKSGNCTSSAGVYACTILVPKDPNCKAGATKTTGNYLNATIQYNDGPTQKTLALSSKLPDITVGSWLAADSKCDAQLGETQANSCYDCGCPTEKYCDYSTDKTTAACKLPITNSNLKIEATPANFYTHSAGDSVTANIQVTNPPSSLVLTPLSCSFACTAQGAECIASCTQTCGPLYKTPDQQAVAMSCDLGFSINNYNPAQSYQLVPSASFSASYNDGAQQKQAQLSSTFNTINIASKWCGDNSCQPDELGSCCFDCGCSEGQYCDTEFSTPSQSDSCKEESFTLSATANQTRFSTQLTQSFFTLTLQVPESPSSVSLVQTACSIPGCRVECTEASQKPYTAACNVTIPSADYKASAFYDQAAKQLKYPLSINATISYKDGPFTRAQVLAAALPTIIVDVNSVCGNKFCDTQLGETQANCCIDCGCGSQEEFCSTFTSRAGACVQKQDLGLQLEGLYEEPARCEIALHGACQFPYETLVNITLANPPDDFRIRQSYYSLSGMPCNGEAQQCQSGTCTGSGGKYTCPIQLPEQDRNPGTIDTTLSMLFTASYKTQGGLVIENITVSKQIQLVKAKSTELQTCEEERASTDKEISSLQGTKNAILGILAGLAILTAGLCLACAITEGSCKICCDACTIGVNYVLPCGAAIAFPIVGSVQSQLVEYKSKKAAICASDDFSSLSDASLDMSGTYYTIAGVAASTICLISGLSDNGAFGNVGAELSGTAGTAPVSGGTAGTAVSNAPKTPPASSTPASVVTKNIPGGVLTSNAGTITTATTAGASGSGKFTTLLPPST